MSNWQPIEPVFEVLSDARKGIWNWTANSKCKYITLRIDIRDGHLVLMDRDNNPITLEELKRQSHPHGGFSWPEQRRIESL